MVASQGCKHGHYLFVLIIIDRIVVAVVGVRSENSLWAERDPEVPETPTKYDLVVGPAELLDDHS